MNKLHSRLQGLTEDVRHTGSFHAPVSRDRGRKSGDQEVDRSQQQQRSRRASSLCTS
jgi:hypothetical protein